MIYSTFKTLVFPGCKCYLHLKSPQHRDKKVYLGALESKFSGNLHDRFGSILRCPIAGFLALIVVGVLAEEIRREDPGTEKMRRIASYIEEGARAFLSREFKTITYFIIPFAFYYGSSYAGRYH